MRPTGSRRWLTTAVVAVASAATVVPATATAPSGPDGVLVGCSVTAVQSAPGVVTGTVQAGPAFVAQLVDGTEPADNPGLAHGDMWCAIQVNDPQSHDGYPPYAFQAISPYSVGVLSIPPTDFSIAASLADEIFVCSGFWIVLPDGTRIHTNQDEDESEAGDQCKIAIHDPGGIRSIPDTGPFIDARYTLDDY